MFLQAPFKDHSLLLRSRNSLELQKRQQTTLFSILQRSEYLAYKVFLELFSVMVRSRKKVLLENSIAFKEFARWRALRWRVTSLGEGLVLMYQTSRQRRHPAQSNMSSYSYKLTKSYLLELFPTRVWFPMYNYRVNVRDV